VEGWDFTICIFVHVVVVMVVGGESENGVGWVRCGGGGVAHCISRYRKNEKKKTYIFSFCFQVS
jgi:hypothetical protein